MSEPSLPNDYCDIVMKGGVTSGVVYPLTVVELAKRYTFKNIGGASAGAIAAAATAAAEYRRRQGSNDGFAALAALPQQLGKPGFLLSLFSPDRSTAPLFRTLLAVADSDSVVRAGMSIWIALVAGYPKSAVLGAVVGAVVPWLVWTLDLAGLGAAVALGALWVLTAITGAVVFAAAKTLPTLVVHNRFGLCTGFRRGAAHEQPPLVNWLYGLFNRIAGLPTGRPLTFRDLHEAPVGGDVTKTPNSINLEMMTTNLTHGRPHRLPLPPAEAATFYFAPEEWSNYFPTEVIEYLKTLPIADRTPVTNAEDLELYPLPSVDLPVIVAVRMSLSFPGLFSAVPLWSVDFSVRKNQRLPPQAPRTAERCWFSDGGLSSNFPVHLFDAPLPRWPTFAINLKDPHPDFTKDEDFVWLPSTNGGGLQPRWNRFDSGPDSRRLAGFVGALIDSMQSWRDNLAARMPGYRNRIVHITQRPGEGGLNLAMPPATIEALSDRGRRAGELLNTEFSFDNHAWVRYRVYMAALHESACAFVRSLRNPIPQDAAAWSWVKNDAPPPDFPSYALNRAAATELLEIASALGSVGTDAPEPEAMAESPKPRPELRLAPRV